MPEYTDPIHEGDDLENELVLSKVISMFKDDWIHGSILCLEDQLSWHQSTLTDVHTYRRDHTVNS